MPPSLAEAMGLFRSPLWLARNRFRPPTFAPRRTQATAPGAARPLPELRVADFRPAAALARGLRQLVPRTLDPLLDRLRRRGRGGQRRAALPQRPGHSHDRSRIRAQSPALAAAADARAVCDRGPAARRRSPARWPSSTRSSATCSPRDGRWSSLLSLARHLLFVGAALHALGAAAGDGPRPAGQAGLPERLPAHPLAKRGEQPLCTACRSGCCATPPRSWAASCAPTPTGPWGARR